MSVLSQKIRSVGALKARLGCWVKAGSARMQMVPPRHRWLLRCVLWLFLLLGLWSIGLAPAWRTWQDNDRVQDALSGQLQQMQALAQEAKHLQSREPPSRADVEKWFQLQVGLQKKSTVSFERERVLLQALEVAPTTLSQWLVQARVQKGLRVTQLDLKKTLTPPKEGAPASLTYSGTVVFAMTP